MVNHPVPKSPLLVHISSHIRTDQTLAQYIFNPLNAELNPVCHLLTLLGAHHILHVSRIRFKNIF